MITVDVEAQPARSTGKPVDQLIWGQFPQGTSGIGEMMTIAERHGVTLTMFLDYAEESIHGDSLRDVGRAIHARGHDLQLHLHQSFLPKSFYIAHGLAPVGDLNLTDRNAAQSFAAFLCDAHARTTGDRPLAFRGGGYRYSGALLDELAAQGLRLDSSYNAARLTQPMNLGPKKQFRWDSGLYEVPVSTVKEFGGRPGLLNYNFNSSVFQRCSLGECVQRHLAFLDRYYDAHGDDAIAVLVMHSWSFLELGDDGRFTGPLPDAANRFDALLTALHEKAEVITSIDAVKLMDRGGVGFDSDVSFDYDPEPSPPRQSNALASMAVPRHSPGSSKDPKCSICGTVRSKFRDAEDKARHCACGSLERQRVFADLYRSKSFNLRGANILAVAPSVSEIRMFADYGASSVTKIDIRPEVRPDIVADICSMPEVLGATYDVVFASYVLTCVYDVDKALAEFARVLKEGGRLFSTDPVATGKATEEFTDSATITSWYGRDALDTYRVGSFRRLGDRDAHSIIGRYFRVDVFTGIDAPTKVPIVWYRGTNPAH